MSESPPPVGSATLILRPEQLDALVAELRPLPLLAVDTEFHAERRYLPALLLVQLAAPDGRAWVIDPLAVPLTGLGPALDGKEWITHGGTQDVRLLHAATGALPGRLLDTQLLAGLSGLPWPARLGDLAQAVLGEPIDKGAALEDWSRRPLPPHQLSYALTDARVTLRLADALRSAPGARLDWAYAAGQELVNDALQVNTDAQWQQLEVAARLDGPARATLSALLAWREVEAEAQNIPPHQIFTNPMALDLARRAPADLGALARNRRLPPQLQKKHGAALVGLIQKAAHAPPPPGPTVQSLALSRALAVWAEIAGPALGIAAGLALPEPLRGALALHGRSALRGWRAEALGDRLVAFLDGRELISAAGGQLRLVEAGAVPA
jgi:ribonuclease D